MPNSHQSIDSGCISLLLSRLPKLPSQCYSNRPCNLGDLGSQNKLQPQMNMAVKILYSERQSNRIIKCKSERNMHML